MGHRNELGTNWSVAAAISIHALNSLSRTHIVPHTRSIMKVSAAMLLAFVALLVISQPFAGGK